MNGSTGDDSYVVNDVGDFIFEGLDSGLDSVASSVTYTLRNNLENLALTGGSAINGTGNASANTIVGNDAANVLNGAAGADTLVGGLGNDVYFVDNVGDVVVENLAEGTDTIKSAISYSLQNAPNVENLTLLGNAAISGTGNAAANLLLGNAAANALDGGLGADTMNGGAGDDTYIVDNVADRVVEIAAAGIDSVQASASYVLAANVENLTLTGGSTINGTGNAAANMIVGNDAANVLVGMGAADTLIGGAGNDALNGGTGNDVLTGGIGADNFFFTEAPGAANSDVISDFTSGADKLRLDDAFFAGIGPLGRFALADARFYAAADAAAGHDADDRIVYDSSTGALYYDADGSGAAVALLFATLQGAPALVATDMTVI
jgi:Ca2+-binding RTX toxin-like protein